MRQTARVGDVVQPRGQANPLSLNCAEIVHETSASCTPSLSVESCDGRRVGRFKIVVPSRQRMLGRTREIPNRVIRRLLRYAFVATGCGARADGAPAAISAWERYRPR